MKPGIIWRGYTGAVVIAWGLRANKLRRGMVNATVIEEVKKLNIPASIRNDVLEIYELLEMINHRKNALRVKNLEEAEKVRFTFFATHMGVPTMTACLHAGNVDLAMFIADILERKPEVAKLVKSRGLF